MADQRLLQVLLGDDEALHVVVGFARDDEGAKKRSLVNFVSEVLHLPDASLLLLHFGAKVVLLAHERHQLLHGRLQAVHQACESLVVEVLITCLGLLAGSRGTLKLLGHFL